MFSSSYYALVAGFREYALDAETKGFDVEAILAEVMEVLSSSDKKAVELLYAYYDCDNLISRRALPSLSPRLFVHTLRPRVRMPRIWI